MRMFASAALATALLGAASIAYAADATGTIKSLDTAKDRSLWTTARLTWLPRA